MSESSDPRNETRHAELLSFVMREVQRILARCEETRRPENALSGCPANNLTALAAEIFGRIETETARRLNAPESREVASLSWLANDPLAHLALEDCPREGARIAEWAGPVAGPTYLERTFGIPRSTLHWWQRHNDVVALRRGARRHVFPLAQFIDGRPAPGIRHVLSSISNPRLAWLWLIRPSPFLGGRVPIEMLREDLSAEVVSAARAFSLTASS
ncbi:antitoxin Xre/MbcA/ParS toxin-binding domain-containing protein [Mesorhizobium sp. WSM2561]|uniref:antitoxin Xre/MbcA/ParS-like domain-containing protein n=1 Tax=Mesorhizobium sp. WSM2561 TaxID=1040985 RepID=UPI001FD8A275|nr:antitoxin Xre/MbcA/ParS toxin-binding domain-containing protein [Mesorhizobium sp. WSM2561]